MHEVLGHGSGRMAERVDGQPQELLKEQSSALEETRADLVALYFVRRPEAGRARHRAGRPTTPTIVRAEYEAYARNALVQLRRVREGTQIEEDHMRNRQMIVHWLMANTNAIEVRRRDGKTYYVLDRPRRSATASARCSPKCSASSPKATTPPRRRCSTPTACTSTRRCATRSSPASTG